MPLRALPPQGSASASFATRADEKFEFSPTILWANLWGKAYCIQLLFFHKSKRLAAPVIKLQATTKLLATIFLGTSEKRFLLCQLHQNIFAVLLHTVSNILAYFLVKIRF